MQVSLLDKEKSNSICKEVESGESKIRVRNTSIPYYADRVEDNLFMWRNVVNPVDLSENDVYHHPFANDSFYVDSQVSLYLMRQDPEGITGLYTGAFGDIEGKIYKGSNNEYKTERDYTC